MELLTKQLQNKDVAKFKIYFPGKKSSTYLDSPYSQAGNYQESNFLPSRLRVIVGKKCTLAKCSPQKSEGAIKCCEKKTSSHLIHMVIGKSVNPVNRSGSSRLRCHRHRRRCRFAGWCSASLFILLRCLLPSSCKCGICSKRGEGTTFCEASCFRFPWDAGELSLPWCHRRVCVYCCPWWEAVPHVCCWGKLGKIEYWNPMYFNRFQIEVGELMAKESGFLYSYKCFIEAVSSTTNIRQFTSEWLFK